MTITVTQLAAVTQIAKDHHGTHVVFGRCGATPTFIRASFRIIDETTDAITPVVEGTVTRDGRIRTDSTVDAA